jgi:hypothetical protein
LSCGHGGQDDEGFIADWGDGFQRHVAGALHGPFIVLLHQDRADEADDSVVGKDADDIGPPLDLAVEPLNGIGRADLVPMLFREGHEGEDVDLGLVGEGGELGEI